MIETFFINILSFSYSNFLSIFFWVVTIAALVGTELNIRKNIYGFVIWIFTNLALALQLYWAGVYNMMFLQLIYVFYALRGVYVWNKQEGSNGSNSFYE
ncbi:MAG: hypothetical protein K8E24_003025 [Methanobacterium paludis]|nr:hypothetical protein [Methanobacterium paludis]